MATDYSDNNKNRRPRERKAEPVLVDPTGKLPPHDNDLEEAVLGALMIEKDAYSEVCDLLTPDSFYSTRNQKIYQAIDTLGVNQRPIDMMTVMEQLRADGTLKEVGGSAFIADLTRRVYTAAHIEYHARIIYQKYIARRLIRFAALVERDSYDEANDIEDTLQEAEAELFKISQTQLKREVVQVDPVISMALEQIETAANRETGLSGLRTGYSDLDKITSGWQPSDLIIIAARPAMGKTAFVLSMAKNMSVDFSIPTAIFTLEMANVQLVKRLFSNVANLSGEKIKSGSLRPDEWSRLHSRLKALYGAPLYLDETPGLSITELRTKARRLVREHGVQIIIIDYLQLMNANNKFGSREQEVSNISRSLKALAKELNIPIIALSQLNRSTETRDDKRPILSDLRESGAIEQDADIVCFIHRPEYYTKQAVNADNEDIRGLAEFIIAKHRSGAVGTVKMRFVSQFARFENWNEASDRMQDDLNAGHEYGDEVIHSRINGTEEDIPPIINIGVPPQDGADLSPNPGDFDVPF